MKKTVITFLLSFILLLNFSWTEVSATSVQKTINLTPTTPSTSTSEIIYQDEDIIIECALTTSNSTSGIQTYSTSKEKKHSKTLTIKNSSGTVLATYKLTGTFTYNGSSASCTKSSYSTSIKNSKWSFTSKTASKSSNKATGSYTLKNSSTGKSYSGSVTITCSKNGTIS